MKYKRQIAAGIFAFALMTGGAPTFAAVPETVTPKMIQSKHQLSMRSDDISDDTDTDASQTKHNHKKSKNLRNKKL